MIRLKIVYVLAVVVLAVLIVYTVKPVAATGKYSEVQREQLLQAKDEWVVQFDIINHEGKDTLYTINVSLAGKQYNEDFLVRNGGLCTYIHHIRRDMAGAGEVGFTIYKKGEDAYIKQSTYYLR